MLKDDNAHTFYGLMVAITFLAGFTVGIQTLPEHAGKIETIIAHMTSRTPAERQAYGDNAIENQSMVTESYVQTVSLSNGPASKEQKAPTL